ncbi:hypothetical protein C8J56DRAFT_1128894 [Mycena floridula]|nr:hypothetical protein C8J56DRAFT_1128894 [Mycena floridula]
MDRENTRLLDVQFAVVGREPRSLSLTETIGHTNTTQFKEICASGYQAHSIDKTILQEIQIASPQARIQTTCHEPSPFYYGYSESDSNLTCGCGVSHATLLLICPLEASLLVQILQPTWMTSTISLLMALVLTLAELAIILYCVESGRFLNQFIHSLCLMGVLQRFAYQSLFPHFLSSHLTVNSVEIWPMTVIDVAHLYGTLAVVFAASALVIVFLHHRYGVRDTR